MIRLEDSEFRIEYDVNGPIVHGDHKPTGVKGQMRSWLGLPIEDVKKGLINSLLADILAYDRWDWSVGSCKVNGKIGSFYILSHQPSGKGRGRNSIEHQTTPQHKMLNELMGEIVAELIAEFWAANSIERFGED